MLHRLDSTMARTARLGVIPVVLALCIGGLAGCSAGSPNATKPGAERIIHLAAAVKRPLMAEQGRFADEAQVELTPAVTSGGVFSDARDTASAALRISPAVSSDGVFSDARDTALSRTAGPAAR
jgi:hypothetical protein